MTPPGQCRGRRCPQPKGNDIVYIPIYAARMEYMKVIYTNIPMPSSRGLSLYSHSFVLYVRLTHLSVHLDAITCVHVLVFGGRSVNASQVVDVINSCFVNKEPHDKPCTCMQVTLPPPNAYTYTRSTLTYTPS